MIVQGDQFTLKFTINSDNKIVTKDDIIGMKIRVGEVIYKYPNDITFDETDNRWTVNIPQSTTLKVNNGFLWCQVQVNFGGTPEYIKTSATSKLKVENGLIKEEWEDAI